MKQLEAGTVTRIEEIRPGIWSMWLRAPGICREARPGQFVHVRIREGYLPLLRRPLSIGRVHGEGLELVWRVVGDGTRLLTRVESGDAVDLLGPLGRPFEIRRNTSRAVLVGGGLGMPPMVYLHEELEKAGVPHTLHLGVKDRNAIPLADDDPVLAITRVTAEEDPAYRRGLVTEPVEEELEQRREQGDLDRTAVYVCGPWGLVGAMQKSVPEKGILMAQVSLEQQMGCAVGVCQGCAVIADGGPTPYRLVCSDGPVFDLFGVEVPHGR